MTELSHETFDIAEAIAGVNFPEVEVPIYFDEAVGFELYQAQETLREVEIREDNKEALRAVYDRIDELKSRAAGARYLVTLRGLPASTFQTIDRQGEEKFPSKDALIPGLQTENPEKDQFTSELVWRHSIVKITNPAGAVSIPTEDQIIQLREKTGVSVFQSIHLGLQELRTGTKSGFEQAAQDTSFLSDASTEG